MIGYRKKTQPLGQPSLGCIFKNPNGVSASQLIDQAGLKNKSIGLSRVSKSHANFFIQQKGGRSQDYYDLIGTVREEISQKHHIDLQLEVQLVGF